MSVVYEPRNFIHDGGYPPMDDEHVTTSPDADQFTDSEDTVTNELATTVASYLNTQLNTQFIDTTEQRLDLPTVPQTATTDASPEHDPGSPTLCDDEDGPILRPVRSPVKNERGKYPCTWANCNEKVREWIRKCEYNKHMDKHERPYKCGRPDCKKLLGFTYPGGLSRHRREVHHLNGGPKTVLYCPHPACKRHEGKGFGRQENLTEHLRRLHPNAGEKGEGVPGDEEEDEMDIDADGNGMDKPSPSPGRKRKRELVNTPTVDSTGELREEIKRVRLENEELRRQVGAQTQQTVIMMQKIAALQKALEVRIPGTVTTVAPPSAMKPAPIPMQTATMI
ncbi:uncharacterized protein C8A04DRAFT_13456 [Dichotomopilus funicola]|uniref:C2H2-type domain-containing protein n=1 Tax=Dichotomopilus funicola TaxID=1934379 RepID=A0AAN6ZLD4_9PEZI|nr:hypothetical protein C8A04DRAFT_13456 [Dichotomopilus funicola]